jgi:cytochrome P450
MEAMPILDPSVISGPGSDSAQMIARVREQDPVCWIPGIDAWVVTGHEDVRRLFTDARVTADERIYARYRPPIDPAARWLSEMPFRSMAADGQCLGRRLVSAALTPRAVARLEKCVREVVEQFAAPLRDRTDRVDLIDEFTAPVSATAIGRILGVSPQDYDDFRRLAIKATAMIRPLLSEEKRERAERAAAKIGNYVSALVRERFAAPGEDFISDLIEGTANGDRSASDEDITRVVTGLVSAGTGTTSVACARALLTLFHHPDQLRLLRRDRSLLPNAVEELLRYDSGILFMPRYVVEDFTLRHQALKRGQLVFLSVMGANRDPRVFPEPDRVDLLRNAKDAVSFGYGAHYCPGASIGRMEMRLMLDAALDFIPAGARLVDEEIHWSKKGIMSQLKSLPVDFTGA